MKPFFSKLLLFGEYGLFYQGAKALSVPFPGYQGAIVRAQVDSSNPAATESLEKIRRFVTWFAGDGRNQQMNFPLHMERLRQDIGGRRFYFDSTIPVAYGTGSSAALCAAIFHDYSSYAGVTPDRHGDLPAKLRHDFALMESYFHGRSSGFDPLVSFYNRPVLLDGDRIVFPDFQVTRLPFSVYLIDTGASAPTAPLVRHFLKQMEDGVYAGRFHSEYLPAVDRAIRAFLSRDTDDLWDHLPQIVRFERDCFSEMIPSAFADTVDTLLSHGICCKLAGSGGGGFLLAFVPRGFEHHLPAGCLKAF